ncbi:MAG TPA: response regulator [Vicinamibacterales bacterium]|nr:response regulator [Vicinamibacterales bacterium]
MPPIVLLVEDDADTRDMYSLFLETSGMWVATAADPTAAADAVVELKPDIIVTDLEFHGERQGGLEFAQALKRDSATSHVPVVLLSGRAPRDLPGEQRRDADLFLVKPVLPEDLFTHIGALLQRSRELRRLNEAACTRAAGLVQKSTELLARSREIDSRVDLTSRRCPVCAQRLQWVETGRIAGIEYDYFHWCDSGCGLYCYDRQGQRWVKLAG